MRSGFHDQDGTRARNSNHDMHEELSGMEFRSASTIASRTKDRQARRQSAESEMPVPLGLRVWREKAPISTSGFHECRGSFLSVLGFWAQPQNQ